MNTDNALIISKLLGGGSRRPCDNDFRTIADMLRLQGRPSAGVAGGACGYGVGGSGIPLPKAHYDQLLCHREQLYNTALAAVKTLLDFDRTLYPLFTASDTAPAPALGLREAVRACAPLIEKKGDWAALYMLANERGYNVGYTDLCRLVGEEAPSAPQPTKQDISQALWGTKGRKFPDWQPKGIQYDKFRRHYVIAMQASQLLTKLLTKT